MEKKAIITGHRLTRTLIDVWPTKAKQQNFPASFSTSPTVIQFNYKFLVQNVASAESEKMNNQHLLPNMNERSSYTFFTTKESPENWHVARLVATAQLRPEKKGKTLVHESSRRIFLSSINNHRRAPFEYDVVEAKPDNVWWAEGRPSSKFPLARCTA